MANKDTEASNEIDRAKEILSGCRRHPARHHTPVHQLRTLVDLHVQGLATRCADAWQSPRLPRWRGRSVGSGAQGASVSALPQIGRALLPCLSLATGRTTTKRLPWPGPSLITSTWPPCNSVSRRTSARPTPRPPTPDVLGFPS
jgi:hypothetical protein